MDQYAVRSSESSRVRTRVRVHTSAGIRCTEYGARWTCTGEYEARLYRLSCTGEYEACTGEYGARWSCTGECGAPVSTLLPASVCLGFFLLRPARPRCPSRRTGCAPGGPARCLAGT